MSLYSQQIVIDFEKFPGPDGLLGTADDISAPVCPGFCRSLQNEYAPLGVNLQGTLFQAPWFPGRPAGNHLISSTPLRGTFSIPVYQIAITSYSVHRATLYAYTSDDRVLVSQSTSRPEAGSFQLATLRVASATPIAKFAVLPDECCGPILNVDDLHLWTTPGLQPGTSATQGNYYNVQLTAGERVFVSAVTNPGYLGLVALSLVRNGSWAGELGSARSPISSRRLTIPGFDGATLVVPETGTYWLNADGVSEVMLSRTGPECQPVTLGVARMDFYGGGGLSGVNATQAPGCLMPLVSPVPWMKPLSDFLIPGSPIGTAVRADLNAGPSRTSYFSLGSARIPVNQVSGYDLNCFYGLTGPNPAQLSAQGGKLSLTVSAAQACRWVISVDGARSAVVPATGSGFSTVTAVVGPNLRTQSRTVTFTMAGLNFAAQQQANGGTLRQRTIEALYWGFLGRIPAAAERDGWDSTGAPLADIAAGFLASPEFQAGGLAVQGIHLGLLDRGSTHDEWKLGRDRIAGGLVTAARMADGVAGSLEAVALRTGRLSNLDFTYLLYENVLGRLADQVSVHVGALDAGAPRAVVLTSFLNSTEYRALTAESKPRVWAPILYYAILDREPSGDELVLQQNGLRQSGIVATAASFLASPEFASLVN